MPLAVVSALVLRTAHHSEVPLTGLSTPHHRPRPGVLATTSHTDQR